jgi:VCBS repeat-containing protein
VDTADTLTWSGSATGAYGALTVNANGTYSYVVNAAAVNALQTGSNTTDNFTVTVTDSQNATTTRTIAMTVVAANDTPVATGTYTHTVTDTAALDTFANLAGTLAATDVDTADTLTWSGSAAGSYGALTVNANGTYSYVVNAAAVNALQTGSNTTDSFTVTVTDSQNATTTRTIEMTVVAANDTPVVSNAPSALTGTVIEAGHLDNGQAVLNGMGVDGLSHITGQLSATDVDAGATQTWSVVGTAPSISYGTFSINAATGQWDFALNNYLPATQALREGDSVSTSYTARVTDDKGAFVDQTVTLTITGTNDVPVVANDAAALLGTVTEVGTSVAGTAAASGQLSASDVDNGATQAWSLVGTPSTTYGSMSIDASTGVWTYTLDNNKAATQALAANQTVLETFTARVTDDKGAFVNQTISVTLNGSDDKTVITGTSSANVAETNAVVTAGGTLIATDPDSSNAFVVQTNALGSNGFGKFSIDAAGVWSYTTDSAQNQFSAGSNYTDSITVAATDGTTQLLTVTIAGSNDAAVITGTSTASLSETNAVLTTGGTLTSTDVDGTANLFTVQSNVAGSNGFGKFSIDAAGVWSYTTDSAHNEFATGTNYTDSITVAAADGTTKVVTVTIAGSNDAAVISGTSTARRTQTNAALTVTGTLTSTDVDNPANLFAAQINAAGSNGYGKFSITTDGAWTYTADSAHNEFIAATDYTDSVTVATADGTTQVVAVTIAGVDDATTGAILISGTSTQGNTLSATSSLADVDSILGTVSYLWKADGQAITGATGSNYTLTAADVGKAITAVASYTIAGVATSSTSNASIASAAGGSTAQSSTVSTLPVTPSGASNSTEVAVVLNSNNGGSDQVQITKSGTGTSSVLPASMTAPLGVLNLTSSGNASGGENFSLYVDSAQGVNGYWVENAAHVWVNLASAAYGGQMVTEGGKTRLDFTIQDGSTYDTNATGNIIAAAGSAAHMELSLIGHTADVPLGGFFF